MHMDRTEKAEFNSKLRKLAVPLGLQTLLGALVGASDALMLGRLNQDSIAAVSLANQIFFIMTLFSGSITGSAGVLIAQYWGKNDYKNAGRFLAMAIRYSLGVSLVFFLAAFCFPSFLMKIFTTDASLIAIGAGYLRIVSFSYIFAAIASCFLMNMKITGDARLSVIVSALTVTIDMVLDYFLIYGKAGVPALGANGSAYSTIVVELFALVFVIVWAKRKETIELGVSSFTFFSKDFEKDLWSILPAMLASALSWGLSITVHNIIMGHLGSDATAAASVTSVAQELISCVSQGIAGGSGIMVGELLGSGQLDKAVRYGDRFFDVSFVNGIVNAILMAIIGPIVYIFYVLTPTAKHYLVVMLIFMAFYMFAYAYNAIFTCGVLPAGGDAKYDAVSVFFATWCFAIPASLIAAFILKLPVLVVYIIMCLDEIVKLPFLRWHYNKHIWVKNLTREID
ncbi:MATE family efflux transporter [Butyrivibrio sp. MB2005]|uniref:MATE family efflux transporter n=1 Tax=Butyrivibrio sp. MB2005 TaxID=1280678 RepID=UPI0004247957|nr:MATE family efflux transporter [Butyrivibrio sp. MB2005]